MNATTRFTRALALGAALIVVPVVVATPASATPTCPVVYWGSTAKTSPAMTSQSLTDVRTGKHDCYDRIVFDITSGAGSPVGYTVEYVSQVIQDGSGDVVPVAGDAKVQITINAPAYDGPGNSTYNPATVPGVSGYQTFRQVAWAGSFEGYTTFGLGVRARLPIRAVVLTGPGSGQRLVVDVYHFWHAF